jgi:hypothetical protein
VIRHSNNYQVISPLSTTYNILSNVLLARLTPYSREITGDDLYGFCHNRYTTNQIFYICQILEKKLGYNGAVHQLFIDYKNICYSVKRVLYSILLEFGIPKKLFRLIKMCSNETYSKVHVCKRLIHFLIRMAQNKEMLYHHCSSILPWNMPSGKSEKIKLVCN